MDEVSSVLYCRSPVLGVSDLEQCLAWFQTCTCLAISRVSPGPGQHLCSLQCSPPCLAPCLRPVLAFPHPSPGYCWPQLLPLPHITEAVFVFLFLFFLFHFTFLFILLPGPFTLPFGNHSDELTVNVLFAYVLTKCVFRLDTYRCNLCK